MIYNLLFHFLYENIKLKAVKNMFTFLNVIYKYLYLDA